MGLVDILGNGLGPELLPPTVGNVSAVGNVLVVDTSKAASVVAHVSGTFAAATVVFEGTLDYTNWFAIMGTRTNSTTPEASAAGLSTVPAYAWKFNVNALIAMRIRLTAITSGTQTWRVSPGQYASEPAVAVGGTLTTVAGTATNLAPIITAATTNLTSWRNTAGNLFEFTVFNPTASPIFVKLYNKSTAPVLATDVPLLTIPVAAGALAAYEFGRVGKRFSAGIAVAVTGAAAATDATAVGAGAQLSATVT